MDPDIPLITDLAQVERQAAENHDRFQVMRYMLERDSISDAQLDALVDATAAPIVDAIDCTQCANCCRSLDVYLTPADAQRLAVGIDVPLDAILDNYVDRKGPQRVGEWGRFRARPCAFLDGRLCSVYAHRPETCRTYPMFTPDFRWVLEDLIDGASLCPIIYNVLLRMIDVTDALSRR
ncbi:MAG: YkgJ family cysteine cluster protein [Chloroflexota bacterium]